MNLSGNPFCQDTNYRAYVIAHLSHLVYLDFRLIDSTTKEAALEQYNYTIEELVHNENLAAKQLEDKQDKEKKTKLHKVCLSTLYAFDVLIVKLDCYTMDS